MTLKQFSRSEETKIAERAEELSNSLLFGPPVERPLVPPRAPFGARYSIWGVGLVNIEDHEAIAIFVEASSVYVNEGERVSLTQAELVHEAIKELYPKDYAKWEEDCHVIGVVEPELYAKRLQATQQGMCGASVTWGNNRNGFFTAGHVAQSQGALVYDRGGDILGTVAASWDPASSQTSADVAVVELATNVSNPGLSLSGTNTISGPTNINIHKAGSSPNVMVVTKTPWFYFKQVNGNVADLYWTERGVTQRGDSGAAATISGTDELIGHVVGGTGTYASFVQDINYQARVIRSAPGFSNIRL
jgi:hypothetical protein